MATGTLKVPLLLLLLIAGGKSNSNRRPSWFPKAWLVHPGRPEQSKDAPHRDGSVKRNMHKTKHFQAHSADNSRQRVVQRLFPSSENTAKIPLLQHPPPKQVLNALPGHSCREKLN
jgi:hypothetical protein